MGGKEKWEMGEGKEEEEKWGWQFPTLTACDRVSQLLHLAWLATGHSISNQHKKILTLTDLNKTWF